MSRLAEVRAACLLGNISVEYLLAGFPAVNLLTVVLSGFLGLPGFRGKGMIMGDEEAAGQQPGDNEKQAKTTGSIYGGDTGPAQPGAEGDPGNSGSINSGDPDNGDDDGPPDDGSIYGG